MDAIAGTSRSCSRAAASRPPIGQRRIARIKGHCGSLLLRACSSRHEQDACSTSGGNIEQQAGEFAVLAHSVD